MAKLNIGNKVKVVSNNGGHYWDVGTTGEILSLFAQSEDDAFWSIRGLSGTYIGGVRVVRHDIQILRESELELVEESE